MTGQVGPRGLAILVLAGITGLLLAIFGWSQRGTGLVAPSVGGLGGSAPTRASAPPSASATTPPASATTQASSAPASSAPASSAPASSTPSAQPSAAASPSATASLGPLLSSEPYAQFAFLVWPGTPTPTAQQAMSGLIVSVTRQAGGIAVRAGVAGQPLPSAQFYAGGGKVYVLESNLGDDSGNLDYNLGDDALIVTNPQGRIVP